MFLFITLHDILQSVENEKNCKYFFLTLFLLALLGCQTISTKVDEATQKEEQELSKWIGKTEAELRS